MDVCIRSRLVSGLAVVGVGALVMSPVVAGQPPTVTPQAPRSAVTLAAVAQPMPSLFTQPPALAAVQQLALTQPLNPLVQQVQFHVGFLTDFISTGAVLFAREFAIPGTLLQDIGNGTPVPTALGNALQAFAQIELEAGGQLVRFAVEYVSFQLNFFVSLATMPLAAVSGLTPAAATPAPFKFQTTLQGSTDQLGGDSQTTTSSKDDPVTPQPRKFRLTVAKPDSLISTTSKTDDMSNDGVTSDLADVDAAATHGRSGVTHKRVSDTGSTTSSTSNDAGATNGASHHEPQHQHDGNAKGGGDKGD